MILKYKPYSGHGVNKNLIKGWRDGQVAKGALSEDPSSVSCSHAGWLMMAWNSTS